MAVLWEEGRFLTDDGRWQEALVVDDAGGIVAVGPREALRARYPEARRVGLQGGMAVPGLWDSHLHLHGLAENRTMLHLDGCTSLDAVLERVAQAAALAGGGGGWIVGAGWNQNLWVDKPHRLALDRVTGDRPAALWARDHHTLWVNTAALRRLGLWDVGEAAGVDRDEAGPTGLLREERAAWAFAQVPRPEPTRDVFRAVAQDLLALGLVGVTAMEPLASAPLLDGWGEAEGLRVQVFWIDDPNRWAAPELVPAGDGRWLRTMGVKLFADGALGTRTAWMKAPYEDVPTQGVPRLVGEPLRRRIAAAADVGWAVAIHAIGDSAVADAWAALAAQPFRGPVLSRIEHAQLVDPADLERLSGQGLAASMQPLHLPGDVPAMRQGWGARSRWAFPWREWQRVGMVVMFGSDAPVVSADPVEGLYAAVFRDSAPPDRPEAGLAPLDALRGYARETAKADARPGGVIAPGQPADLTVFREDPLAVLEEGGRPTVLGTVVGGRIRWWRR
jgi:predicted amidohydrolase YtcJ